MKFKADIYFTYYFRKFFYGRDAAMRASIVLIDREISRRYNRNGSNDVPASLDAMCERLLYLDRIDAVRIKPDKIRVRKAPGSELFRMISFAAGTRATESIFKQSIADMREEYFEALAAGRQWHARWINIRGHLDMALTFVAYVSTSLAKRVTSIWRILG